jgi:hypothetical protein
MNNCPTNLLFSSNYHVHIFLSYKIEITRRYTDYYNLYRSSTKVKHDIQLQDEYLPCMDDIPYYSMTDYNTGYCLVFI